MKLSKYKTKMVFICVLLLTFVILSASLIRANFKGEWKFPEVYVVDDVVTYGGSAWICKLNHTSNATWYPGASGVWFWETYTGPIPTATPTPIPTAPPTPGEGDISIHIRDVATKVYPGAQIKVVADFRNESALTVEGAQADIILPTGASLHTDYTWNTTTQLINGVGAMCSKKNLPADPPQLYVYGTDDFNNTVEDSLAHIKPLEQIGKKMSANILAGALYYDAWDPDVTSFYGSGLAEYMYKKNYEIGAHTFHHSHMGLDLHMNSKWIGETTRRYKRGTTWGVPNTEQEQMMEITLGKYWNEIYFNRRIEGFRSPFLEFDIAQGAESSTKSPLRSSKWKVIGKSGLRYVCTVNEGPSGWPPQEIAKTPLSSLDPRTCIPSWPPLCDEVTAASDPKTAYTDASHNVHNILVGTQRCNLNGTWTWGTIFDDSFIGNFSYADSMTFLKRNVDRHFTITQDEIPHPYIDGTAGPNVTQKNIPVSIGLHAGYTNDTIPPKWAAENKKGNDWVADIDQYIQSTYPAAKNVTHKDVLDYYEGRGTIRWYVNVPTTPGTYTISIKASDGSVANQVIQVVDPAESYATAASRSVNIASVADVNDPAIFNYYSDVIFTVKGEIGQPDIAGLDAVITAAQAKGLGVFAKISVFKDTDMHSTTTLDYTGAPVANMAEPTDKVYRDALKALVTTISSKNIKGIILDADYPTTNGEGATYGYSDAMITHFNKYFGPPPSGVNPQDPTSESDALHWSIYTAAATDDWRTSDIPWLTYDIKTMVNTYFTTGTMANLGTDANGVQVVDWLLCKQADASDNTGVSSWDEYEAWGEYRSYMMADFVNEVAGGKGTKDVFVIVDGDKDGNELLKNKFFGSNTDPIEYADITRRPNILPDLWNGTKSDNINGIIYLVDAVESGYIKECVELARRIDYWVAKGGNMDNGIMPVNEYRPMNDSKVYGILLETKHSSCTNWAELLGAGASTTGTAPFMVAVTVDQNCNGNTTPTPTPTVEPTPVYTNIALGKTVAASSEFSVEYPVTNIVDGNDTTMWGSAVAENPSWVYVDLGPTASVKKLTLNWANPFFAKKYQIYVSNDAKTWTQVYSDNLGNGGSDVLEVADPVKIRYIGIYMTVKNDAAYALKEVEVLGLE